MKDFNEKTALITGGSSGIGLALAKLFAQEGAHVTILARRKEQLDLALQEITACRRNPGQRFGTLSANVCDEKQVKAEIGDWINKEGLPDILINCAGSAYPMNFERLESSEFHKMMDLNFFGTLYPIQALTPGMIQRKSGQIVNICSMSGYLGIYGYTAYSAAKYAVRGFSDALRSELQLHGIRVSLVFPRIPKPRGLSKKIRSSPLSPEMSPVQPRPCHPRPLPGKP